MRNLLALLAAALLAFVGVGWYLDWYQVKTAPAPAAGHHSVNIDINSVKILEDGQKGLQKVGEKVQTALDKNKPDATGQHADHPADAPAKPTADK